MIRAGAEAMLDIEFQAIHRQVDLGKNIKRRYEALWGSVTEKPAFLTKALRAGKDMERKLMLVVVWLDLEDNAFHTKDVHGGDYPPRRKFVSDIPEAKWQLTAHLRTAKGWADRITASAAALAAYEVCH